MKLKIYLQPVSIFIALMLLSNSFYAANRYWVGTGSGYWNSTSNWSSSSGGSGGSSVPNTSDTSIFDGGNTANCTINANINVASFRIASTYSGTISMSTGITLTVATSCFSQEGGIFVGNNGNISINGSFELSGGEFTSTTGTMQIASGFAFTGGIFNHNNGTVTFSTTQTITGNATFYNIIFISGGGTYTIASGTTIKSTKNVTTSGSASLTINTGILEIQGDLTLTTNTNNSVNGGTATFLFTGTGSQNITSDISTIIVGTNERVSSLPNIEINKTSGSLKLKGVINLNGTTWKTTAGASLINADTSTININSNITFSGENLSLYNIHIYANSAIVTLSPSTYILTSTHNLTINGGSYYQINTGTLEILGNLTLLSTSTSSANGGTGTLLFDGTETQYINSSVSSLDHVCALPSVKINKSSGSLNFTGIINFTGSSWNTVAGNSLINPGTSTINILKGATLSGQDLTLYDIVVTGTFNTITINTGVKWTSTHLITFAGGTSWYQINTGTLNAKGNVTVTNTNTSNNLGGSAVLLFDGNANQLLTGSGIAGGGRLPKVQIDKNGGVLTLSNNIISTDNAWDYIAGNVDASTNASTVDFYKTSTIDGQGTSSTMAFYHVIFSGLISLGGNMKVGGDFTIRSGVNNRLDVNSSNNYQLNIAGNWINNNSTTASSFNQQSGKVVFDGGAAQSLTLAQTNHVEIFYNIEINNTSSGLTLNAPITISNNIEFIKGNIIATDSNIVVLNNAATATGASDSSFISGPITKTGNQAFTFPVGQNSVYAPITMSAPAVNTNQFTAQYFQTNPNTLYNASSKDVSLNYLSKCEYWTLSRTTGTSSVYVTLSWDKRSCGINNLNDLRVVRWNGSSWKDHGNGGTTGTLTSGTVISANAISSFSPFTLASSTGSNPLPVSLVSFDVEKTDANSKVKINWETASEYNSDYFLVEKSIDELNFETIGKTKAAGISNKLIAYSFIDKNPVGGNNYYRLSELDYNGNIQFSPFRVINFSEEKATVNIYPNPFTTTLYVALSDALQLNKLDLKMYNILGEEVMNITLTKLVNSIPTNNLPLGIYIYKIISNNVTIQSGKLISH